MRAPLASKRELGKAGAEAAWCLGLRALPRRDGMLCRQGRGWKRVCPPADVALLAGLPLQRKVVAKVHLGEHLHGGEAQLALLVMRGEGGCWAAAGDCAPPLCAATRDGEQGARLNKAHGENRDGASPGQLWPGCVSSSICIGCRSSDRATAPPPLLLLTTWALRA